MKMCSICKERPAVVFVSKIDGTGRVNEGYCLPCALKTGITSKEQIADQIGMPPEFIDSMVEEMSDENLDPQDIMSNLSDMLSESNIMEMMPDSFKNEEQGDAGDKIPINDKKTKQNIQNEKKKKKCLNKFGVNLTEKAKHDLLDKVIGREKEIDRVIQILNRRTKNNPVLLGAPGVGKTAIAEAIAQKIASKNVPERLINTQVYLLDMSSIVAGTQYRGQFESRMKSIIEEAKDDNVILVIDEIHTIAAAGDADGAMNAGNILKPALTKGDIQIIGATTPAEYRKYIEKDAALERRFQAVNVEEPTREETFEMLCGIKKYYEAYHNVTIDDSVLREVIDLSCKYISNRFLPDKAIDVVDEAASKLNISNPYSKTIIEKGQKIKELELDIENLESSAENGKAKDDNANTEYEKIATMKSEKCRLEGEVANLRALQKQQTVTLEDVAQVIELWTGIPVKNITETDKDKLINLEDRLHKRVIGQDEAVKTVADAVRRNRVLKMMKKRPVSMIFIGPTGVGKTELVKALAQALFDDESAMIRVDMSEYMEKHSVAKIIGAPPGYVGYDDAGQLTEKVRRKPYSVILLDEIEKAHQDVFNILLQILDDGFVTDSQGRKVNFENTIIIMTSNAGTSVGLNNMGFNSGDKAKLDVKIERALKETFRPEFLNRIDAIIEFKELKKDELVKILDLMLKDLADELERMGLKLEISDAAKDLIIEKGYYPKYGARPLRREIQNRIENEVSRILLSEDVSNKSNIIVDAQNGEMKIEII